MIAYAEMNAHAFRLFDQLFYKGILHFFKCILFETYSHVFAPLLSAQAFEICLQNITAKNYLVDLPITLGDGQWKAL